MGTFKKLKNIKAAIARIPGIVTYKDFDISVEIGYHQELGNPLTLKQLLLLNLASPATVRRHIGRLAKEGMILKYVAENDHRSVCLILSESAIKSLSQYLEQLSQTLNPPTDSAVTDEVLV
ncbi:MAG TPA: hypothetical protein VGK14_02165 [Novimethylophilus sp.]|jgi:DNA-binding MarR family transcriptional regulator|uniref:hypothetical protein n=1 Tax=Novimethylophilus sp. TaxID=2137426 RepID=UPI002F420B8F